LPRTFTTSVLFRIHVGTAAADYAVFIEKTGEALAPTGGLIVSFGRAQSEIREASAKKSMHALEQVFKVTFCERGGVTSGRSWK
jgi:hypothetical protein